MISKVIVGLSLISICLSQMMPYRVSNRDRVNQELPHKHRQQELIDLQISCLFTANNYFFNLKPLAEYTDNNDLVLPSNTSDRIYHLSFCNYLPDNSSCSQSTMATVYGDDIQDGCAYLSGSNLQEDFDINYVSETNGTEQHIKISYLDGQEYTANSAYNLTVEVFCSSDNTLQTYSVEDSDQQNPYIAIYSSTGCSTDAFWTWIANNKWAMFAISIVIGFIVCFFGRKLWKPIFFLCGVLLTVFIVLIVFYTTFLDDKTESWVGWVVIACSVLVGLLVGFIFMKVSKLGAFVLAGWGGYCLGLLIWNSFLYLATSSNVLFWCFTIGCGVVIGILAIIFFDHIIILSSAMAGAYVFVAGIGYVAGRYQNPYTIYTSISDGVTIDPVFYAYLAGTLVLFVIGAIVQYKAKANENQFKHPYHNLK